MLVIYMCLVYILFIGLQKLEPFGLLLKIIIFVF